MKLIIEEELQEVLKNGKLVSTLDRADYYGNTTTYKHYKCNGKTYIIVEKFGEIRDFIETEGD